LQGKNIPAAKKRRGGIKEGTTQTLRKGDVWYGW